jgi:hypothetical protein
MSTYINGQLDTSGILNMGLNPAVHTIAKKLFPCGYLVSETEAPATYEALRERLNSGQPMMVYSGASDNTIFGDREVNWAFRAWHDWCHWKGGYDFTSEGEAAACEMQVEHIKTLYGDNEETQLWADILRAEVNGQAQYEAIHGEFPKDQKAFIREYLKAPEVALFARF